MSGELRFCVTKFQAVQENEDCIALWRPLWCCTVHVLFPNVLFEPLKPQLGVDCLLFYHLPLSRKMSLSLQLPLSNSRLLLD